MDGHRSFVDDATELTLGLPGTVPRGSNKRALPEEDKGESRMNEAKVQVVGWPPVRSYRRSNMQKRKAAEAVDESSSGGMYVKVGMDGAPYLRKIDLEVYKSYKELRENLVGMFKGFSLGEYVITYEDKDGDWMMVGDVPWEMFISTCKRLRIMKGSEARGVGSNP